MFEKLDECPLCGSTQFQNFKICKDYTVSQESFAIVKCNSCQLLFTNPRPNHDTIQNYYQSDSYISHSNKSKSFLDIVYKLIRNYSLKKKVKLISSITKGRKLLDFGSGTGHFLLAANKKEWDVYGVEPSNTAKSHLPDNLKSKVKSSLNQLPEENTFDVITLWHVLEHVHDLTQTLNSLIRKLNKGGKLVIAVPNPSSFDAQYFQEFWAAYDVPRHLYHFTKKTMAALTKSQGLSIDNTVPMKFDSFYVSLLSNKHKYGHQKLINSFVTGYKSNTYANKTGEYSSLIYIISKK